MAARAGQGSQTTSRAERNDREVEYPFSHGNMHEVYETYIESLSDSVDEQALARALSLLLKAFGFGRFAYLSFQSGKKSEPRLITNYPTDWTTSYLNRHYAAIDPVVSCARCTDEPFRWGKGFRCRPSSSAQYRLFEEAAEFGICNGMTIPIHDRRCGVAAVTLATDESDPALLRVADRHVRALQLAATCFHIHVRRKLSADRVIDGVILTPREFECLQWAARGKSAWEIGCILGVARRTAAFHLDNARSKLGVRTIAQAVVRLAASGSSHP